MLLATTLVSLALTASPDSPALDRLQALLDERKCDEAFLLLSEVKVPAQPGEAETAKARKLAQSSSACVAEDPAIGVAFTSLAARLAPKDPQVELAHAEALIAADQRGEAASRLDKILASKSSPARARLVRGELAAREGEHALAVETLRPLLDHPEHGQRAADVIALSERAQEKRQQNLEQLSAVETQVGQAAREAKSEEAAPKKGRAKKKKGEKKHFSLSGSVDLGESRQFQLKGARAGQEYVFSASGECTRKAKKKAGRGKVREDPKRSIFGVDFAVQFGQQAPRQLHPGQHKTEETTLRFVADEDDVAIRVFDRSSVDDDVRCSVSNFSVDAAE